MPSRSFRNNNPGNLRASEWTRMRLGYIGDDTGALPGQQPGMAKFLDWWDGLKAMGDLLQTPKYQAMDVRGLIGTYAPPSENDTARYITQVCIRSGCKPEERLSEMTPVQFLALLAAMINHEGWTP